MIQRPLLSEGQFAVSMADAATGHVLTTQREVCHSDGKGTFFVFDDLEVARRFIEANKMKITL
jgi:hypothetical protein